MRRDVAFALAAVFVVAAIALVVLSTTGSAGGMMGGMMGGAMIWMGLGGLLFLLAVVLLVVAVVSPSSAAPVPGPVAPPSPPSVAPWAPPASPHGESPPAASVEAAVVKLLDEDERLLYTRLRDAGGTVLQKDVVAWGAFSPAKVTRLLDRLETKGLVVRERHGMTNRIRLEYR